MSISTLKRFILVFAAVLLLPGLSFAVEIPVYSYNGAPLNSVVSGTTYMGISGATIRRAGPVFHATTTYADISAIALTLGNQNSCASSTMVVVVYSFPAFDSSTTSGTVVATSYPVNNNNIGSPYGNDQKFLFPTTFTMTAGYYGILPRFVSTNGCGTTDGGVNPPRIGFYGRQADIKSELTFSAFNYAGVYDAFGNSSNNDPWITIYSTPYTAPPDYTTHIVDFTPHEGDIISTSTGTVSFTLTAYINPDDFGSTLGIQFTLHNLDQNVLLLSAFSPSDIYLLSSFNATSSGYFYFSTSTVIGAGNYSVKAALKRAYFGIIENPFSPINKSLEHAFIVGSGTWIGNFSQKMNSDIAAHFASTTATSTAVTAGNCVPLGDFNAMNCVTFLFLPSPAYLTRTYTDTMNGILTRFPLGYFTRMVTIFNLPATTSLPAFTAHFQTGPGDSGTPDISYISIDPGDMLAGAGALVDSIHDPINRKTPRDIFVPIVGMTVALGVLLTIYADLARSHNHHGGTKSVGGNKKKA